MPTRREGAWIPVSGHGNDGGVSATTRQVGACATHWIEPPCSRWGQPVDGAIQAYSLSGVPVVLILTSFASASATTGSCMIASAHRSAASAVPVHALIARALLAGIITSLRRPAPSRLQKYGRWWRGQPACAASAWSAVKTMEIVDAAWPTGRATNSRIPRPRQAQNGGNDSDTASLDPRRLCVMPRWRTRRIGANNCERSSCQ